MDATVQAGSSVLIRGLRDTTDFAYEMQMAGMNSELAPGLETVFLPASGQVRHIASSLVKQIAVMGGEISGSKNSKKCPFSHVLHPVFNS